MTIQTEVSKEERISLTYLRARNFRSLHDVRLDIGPGVTVLAGPNASGKSNIVDAMSFVSDALYDGVDRAVGNRGARAILHRHGGKVGRSFTIGLGLESSAFIAHHEFKIRIQRRGEVAILDERISGEIKPPGRKPFRFSLKDISKTLTEYPSDTLMLSVMGDSPTVANLLTSLLMRSNGPAEEINPVGQAIVDMTNFIGDMRFYHLFPNVMREPKRLKTNDKLEEDGENLASVLLGIVKQKGDAYRQLLDALIHVVPDVEDVRVLETGGYHYVQLKHRSLSSSAKHSGWLDISNESDGTVRTLGFFVALYQDPPPALIAIEEPELTVHVGALEILAETLNEVGLRSQIVITTHSCDLLDCFQEDSLRAVVSEEGRTKTGRVRENQAKALKQALLTAGDIHRMEGLSVDGESNGTDHNTNR